MGKLTGFREIDRAVVPYRPPQERLADFDEILTSVSDTHLQDQGARCMDCGVPFCQVHCPLHNNIPDWLKLTAEGPVKDPGCPLHGLWGSLLSVG